MSNTVPQLIPYGNYQRQQSLNPNTAQAIGTGFNDGGEALIKGSPATGPAAPIVAGVGAGMQAVGTIANIYGAYKAQEEAKKQAAEEQRRWEIDNKMRQQQLDSQAQQQAFNNEQSSGTYAQNYQDNIAKNYGNYYAQNRL
jgi:hypothetical protein